MTKLPEEHFNDVNGDRVIGDYVPVFAYGHLKHGGLLCKAFDLGMISKVDEMQTTTTSFTLTEIEPMGSPYAFPVMHPAGAGQGRRFVRGELRYLPFGVYTRVTQHLLESCFIPVGATVRTTKGLKAETINAITYVWDEDPSALLDHKQDKWSKTSRAFVHTLSGTFSYIKWNPSHV